MDKVVPIEDIHDPRLAAYQNLRNRNPIAGAGYFIVESQILVQRLVDSSYQVASIVVESEKYVHNSWLELNVPIYCVPNVSELIGFNFHRGALACGLRRTLVSATDVLSEWQESGSAIWKSVYLHQVQDPENMGSIFRTCALGINNVIVGNSCVDPYARRVVRVSMGNSLKLNVMRDRDISNYLKALEAAGVTTIASTLSADAGSLRDWKSSKAWTLVLGNEANGLPDEIASLCTNRLTIPMYNAVDSLNVSNAASIFLYVLAGE